MGLAVRYSFADTLFHECEFLWREKVFDLFIRIDGEECESDIGEDVVLMVPFGETAKYVFLSEFLKIAEIVFVHGG